MLLAMRPAYWPCGSAGEIDLQAKLTRGRGRRWRYLPRVVGSHTQDWCVPPFAGRGARGQPAPARRAQRVSRWRGEFRVVIRVANATLDYATGWPVIEGIFGEVRFEGPGMRIEARARIFGAALTDVVADVPDLDVQPSEVMTHHRQGSGAERRVPALRLGQSVRAHRWLHRRDACAGQGPSGPAPGDAAATAGGQHGRGRVSLRCQPLVAGGAARARGRRRAPAPTADTLSLPEARAQFLGASRQCQCTDAR